MSTKNRQCPKCAEVGHDKSGDHLYLLKDGEGWYCNKPYHPPYLERPDGGEVAIGDRESISSILTYPISGNAGRGITKETHEYFRVRTSYSTETGEQVATFYPELVDGMFNGYKKRKHPKSFTTILKGLKGSPDFFGQDQCPVSGKRLLICAGEEDTMAAYQMLKDKYPNYTPMVVGLPRGEGGSNSTLADRLSFIGGFDEVIIATDMDEAGKKALSSIVPILGEGTKYLNISEKDINDMLIKNKAGEFLNAYFSAREYRPANIIDVNEILENAISKVEWGLGYPWKGLTELTYGMKKVGEIIGIGGAPGSGKSTLIQMIQNNLIFTHKEQIAIFDIEEGAEMGLKKLIGACMNKPIHKPDCDYDIEEARRIGASFNGLAHFYGGDSENWDEVVTAIRYYASKGIKYFFVDPLSAIVEHLTASEANTELGRIMRDMRKLRKKQGLTFFHTNHLNNPNTGKEHGEGGAVRGGQFAGSRAQWKYSTLLLGIERNQYAEDKDERDTMTLRVLKDRLGGNTGYLDLSYDTASGTLVEDYLLDGVL